MSARPPSLRAVLFDWDGTLVNSAETSYRAYVSLFESSGIPFDREVYRRHLLPQLAPHLRGPGPGAGAMGRRRRPLAPLLRARSATSSCPACRRRSRRSASAGMPRGSCRAASASGSPRRCGTWRWRALLRGGVCGGDTASASPIPSRCSWPSSAWACGRRRPPTWGTAPRTWRWPRGRGSSRWAFPAPSRTARPSWPPARTSWPELRGRWRSPRLRPGLAPRAAPCYHRRMTVPMVDLQAQLDRIRPEVDAAMARVLESTRFIGGDECARLRAGVRGLLRRRARLRRGERHRRPDPGPARLRGRARATRS